MATFYAGQADYIAKLEGMITGSTPFTAAVIGTMTLYNGSTNALWTSSSSTFASIILATSIDHDRSVEHRYTPGTTGALAGAYLIGQINKNNANFTHAYTDMYAAGSAAVRVSAPSGTTLQVFSNAGTNPNPFAIWAGAGTGYFVFLRPRAAAGAHNGIVQAGDGSLIFSQNSADTGAFVFGPWSSGSAGFRMDQYGTTTLINATSGSAALTVSSIGTNTYEPQLSLINPKTGTGLFTIIFFYGANTLQLGLEVYTFDANNAQMQMKIRGNGTYGGTTFIFDGVTGGILVPNSPSATAPTASADRVWYYSTDDAAGHTVPSFMCEGTNVVATGQADSASSVRVKMRINGTVRTFLCI